MPNDALLPSFGPNHNAQPAPPRNFLHAAAPALRAGITETVATLREVALMSRDLRPIVPEYAAPHDDVVVLVHGFFASAGVFRPLRAKLSATTNAKIASFSHIPGQGVDRIAQSLARLIDRLPKGCRIHLIGHSLGGVVARWYVQELGGHTRVRQTISLGSPFGGTEHARLFPFLVGADLHRSSALLARLRAKADEHDVPHTSIVGDADTVVVPYNSAIFPRGNVQVLTGRGHNTLLFDEQAVTTVVEQIRSQMLPVARAYR
jgi:triacylglycerol lipase